MIATTIILAVKWPKRSFVLLLAALSAMVLPPAAVSAETALLSTAPPASFRLDAVKIRLHREPGAGQPKLALLVNGAGGATLESGRPPVTRAFTLPSEAVVALLNHLYRMRFFELPDVLRARQSVFLMPEGYVGTQSARLMDATSNTVCVALPAYEKCVRYTEGDGPHELEAWAQAAFADAQRRVQPTDAGK